MKHYAGIGASWGVCVCVYKVSAAQWEPHSNRNANVPQYVLARKHTEKWLTKNPRIEAQAAKSFWQTDGRGNFSDLSTGRWLRVHGGIGTDNDKNQFSTPVCSPGVRERGGEESKSVIKRSSNPRECPHITPGAPRAAGSFSSWGEAAQTAAVLPKGHTPLIKRLLIPELPLVSSPQICSVSFDKMPDYVGANYSSLLKCVCCCDDQTSP